MAFSLLSPVDLPVVVGSTATDHLTVQVDGGLTAPLDGGLVEVSQTVVHQGADHAVLHGIDQETAARLAELEDVVIDVNLERVLAGESDLLDAGEPAELFIAGFILLAVGEIAGDVAIG